MKIPFGKNAAEAKRGNDVIVEWDSTRAINGHIILLGDSGTGKTHNLKHFITSMAQSSSVPARFHIFDAHGDIQLPGASTVLFSESSDYGFNPLVINPDLHFGGVRKRIQNVISTINRTSRQLGPKQEAVLRNILLDLYAMNGYKSDNPASWAATSSSDTMEKDGRVYLDVPYPEKDIAKSAGAHWDGEETCWWIEQEKYTGPALHWPPKPAKRCPTLLDAVNYAKYKLQAMFIGADQSTVNNLEAVNRVAKAFQGKWLRNMRDGDAGAKDQRKKEMTAAGEKAINAYKDYIESIKTGRELDDLIKYDSSDVLKSVVDRLENLYATGIFRNTVPPFDPRASAWRYDIKALNEDEKKMFVDFRLEAIFTQAVQRGIQNDIIEVIILDEAHLYMSDEPDHILNKLVKEARKYGVALVLASQSPSHFPDDLISGVGTKVYLGLDQFFWPMAKAKLGIDLEALKFIVAKKRLVVQMKVAGDFQSRSQWVLL